MNETDTRELASTIRKRMATLSHIFDLCTSTWSDEIKTIGKTEKAAIIVAGVLVNYYTCLESIFMRISQFFENKLDQSHWHTDLLEKMTLGIEDVRISAVSDENYSNILELFKFRHFKRYYFEMEFDWDRLEFLTNKLKNAHPCILEDLDRFLRFLSAL